LTSSSILLFFSLLLHRYPFSFPTRRSSDLFCTVKVREVDGHDDTACRLCNRSIEICRISGERSSHNDLSVYAVNTARTFDHFPKDRKSTRLNSSHVSISYAVFCLKQKTTRI